MDIQSFRHSVATDQLSYPSKALYHQREFVGIVDSDLRILQLLPFQTMPYYTPAEENESLPKEVQHVTDHTGPPHPQPAGTPQPTEQSS